MNHDEAARLLGPYRDGELDLATCLKLEEHLAGCPICQQKLTGEKELADLIHSETPRFTASPFLKTRIQVQLREEKEKSTGTTPSWNPIALAWTYSSVAIAVMVILGLVVFWTQQQVPAVVHEGVADHVRSLQVTHLIDIASSDQHTVKPWFAGKLDYSPQVVDLGPSGYPLVGGRLDVLDHRNVAAIVYQRRKHFINLFIWPSATESLHGRLYDENGYHALGWTKSGMNYLAVSEIGEKELLEFVELLQNQTVDLKTGE